MNRFSYTITPRGEIHLHLPNHSIHLNQRKAHQLQTLISEALDEQRWHPVRTQILRAHALTAGELAAKLGYGLRKALRRAGRGKSNPLLARDRLSDLSLAGPDGLTRRGNRVLAALNKQHAANADGTPAANWAEQDHNA